MYLDSVRSGHIDMRSKHTFTSGQSVEAMQKSGKLVQDITVALQISVECKLVY